MDVCTIVEITVIVVVELGFSSSAGVDSADGRVD